MNYRKKYLKYKKKYKDFKLKYGGAETPSSTIDYETLKDNQGIIFGHANQKNNEFCLVPDNLIIRPTSKTGIISNRAFYTNSHNEDNLIVKSKRKNLTFENGYNNKYTPGSLIPNLTIQFSSTYPERIINIPGFDIKDSAVSYTGIITEDLIQHRPIVIDKSQLYIINNSRWYQIKKQIFNDYLEYKIKYKLPDYINADGLALFQNKIDNILPKLPFNIIEKINRLLKIYRINSLEFCNTNFERFYTKHSNYAECSRLEEEFKSSEEFKTFMRNNSNQDDDIKRYSLSKHNEAIYPNIWNKNIELSKILNIISQKIKEGMNIPNIYILQICRSIIDSRVKKLGSKSELCESTKDLYNQSYDNPTTGSMLPPRATMKRATTPIEIDFLKNFKSNFTTFYQQINDNSFCKKMLEIYIGKTFVGPITDIDKIFLIIRKRINLIKKKLDNLFKISYSDLCFIEKLMTNKFDDIFEFTLNGFLKNEFKLNSLKITDKKKVGSVINYFPKTLQIELYIPIKNYLKSRKNSLYKTFSASNNNMDEICKRIKIKYYKLESYKKLEPKKIVQYASKHFEIAEKNKYTNETFSNGLYILAKKIDSNNYYWLNINKIEIV